MPQGKMGRSQLPQPNSGSSAKMRGQISDHRPGRNFAAEPLVTTITKGRIGSAPNTENEPKNLPTS